MKEAKRYLMAYIVTKLLGVVIIGGMCVLGALALGATAGFIGYFTGSVITMFGVFVSGVSCYDDCLELKKLLEEAEEEP